MNGWGTSARPCATNGPLYRGDGAGGFSPDPESGCEVPGDQRALIPFDFNRDGYPDLLITQVDKPTLLLENRTHGAHWLTVGPGSHRGRGLRGLGDGPGGGTCRTPARPGFGVLSLGLAA